MKMLMGAVIVLSMAAVTACGKKPEVVEEKNVESVHEETEMADEQMTGSEHEETTESVDEEIAEIPETAGQEFAWFYPSIHWNDLMIQMYGTEAYHTVRLIEDYSDYGG